MTQLRSCALADVTGLPTHDEWGTAPHLGWNLMQARWLPVKLLIARQMCWPGSAPAYCLPMTQLLSYAPAAVSDQDKKEAPVLE